MLAHEIVDRVTKDVDLFTDRDAEEAVRLATALRTAWAAEGFRIEPAARPQHENRFVAVDPATAGTVQIEVFPDGGRLHPPVQLGVGPVLHRDDLAADKLLAMWGRGEPRDYVDVVALLGIYGGETLAGACRRQGQRLHDTDLRRVATGDHATAPTGLGRRRYRARAR